MKYTVTHYSDAAKRLADEYNMHRVAAPYDSIGKWFAAALTDGSSDHVLYPSKVECVRHQHHNENYYAFVQIVPSTMSYKDAETFLKMHRKMYDAGLKMADRDTGGKDMIRRLTQVDQERQLRALFKGDKPPTNIIYN